MYEPIKRAFDLIVAGIGLIVLSPLLLLIAATIKLTSPGPVFYRGVRTGRHGMPFRIFKFRTMVVNAETIGGPSTGHNDPRVTLIGAFLREYKLDELPQLINVLTGEMSIVGPRPEVLAYTSLYTGDKLLILTVRPGITDYASIKFIKLARILGSEQPDRVYEEQVRPIKNDLRVKYVQERSLWVDLKIILMTLRRMAGS